MSGLFSAADFDGSTDRSPSTRLGWGTALDLALALFGGTALVAAIPSPTRPASMVFGTTAAALLLARTAAGLLAQRRAVRLETRDRERCRDTEDRLARAHTMLAEAAPFEVTGRIAAGIVHDVNNLLTVILSYLGDWRMSGRSAAEFRDDIAEVERLTKHGGEVARHLLGFLRPTARTSSTADANDVVHGMRRILERVLGPAICLDIKPGVGIGRCRLAPADLSRILVNLTLNARHAMPEGGRFEIETANVYREEAAAPSPAPLPGHYIMIAVTDTGRGIPESFLRELFRPLATTRAACGGTGLGLSSSNGIITAAGGYLTVRSELERGTRFEIYLPRVEDIG